MSWQEIHDAQQQQSSGGDYLRLKDDGDRAVVAFLGEPRIRKVVWLGDKSEEYDAVRHAGEQPKMRLVQEVYNRDVKATQTWETSLQVAGNLEEITRKYGLRQWYEIRRKGKAGDMKTTYLIMPDGAIEDTHYATITGGDIPF